MLWWGNELVVPSSGFGVEPHELMPETVATDFREASEIATKAPRAAAALLRLALERLLRQTTGTTKMLDKLIEELVANGVPQIVSDAMDIVRVHGNDAIHSASEIDLSDDLETVTTLANLVNYIVEEQIARPALIADKFNKLPASKREAALTRNARAKGTT